ncbi:MAG: ROK family protein [Verrucomicrobia bacterium]|nr:MAG: ROK family protein [Verrucomicrobiota bacterium]
MASTSSSPKHLLGIDLGGTKILAGVFNSRLDLIGKAKKSTKARRGVEAVVERIARCALEAIDECDLQPEDVAGVGIGAPGATDPETGRVIFAPNLQWRDVPLKAMLEKQLSLPVFIENDCNIQALGVHQAELDGKPRHMVGIFLGTGIGAGLILDGRLFSGFNRTAGEIGHMVLDIDGPKCGCGNRGCFEALASRTAIFNRLKEAVAKGRKTALVDMLGPGLKDMRSNDLRKAIEKKKDKLAKKIVEDAARYTGIAVASVINLLNPEVVVLGGGLMEALGEHILPIAEKTARKYAMDGVDKGIRIVASKLGDHAGITGGAVLARMRLQQG